ncbi:MAG: ethylbenzene dehydrogenase-related protein, partial [Fidelibacterota bacterium]
MKDMKYVLSGFVLITVVLFTAACEKEAGKEEVTSLNSASVSTGPVLDGNGSDAVWANADAFVVTVGASGSYANAFGEVDVTLKSVHTATDVYILASWEDPSATENVDKKLWSYESGAWTQSGNEDRLYLMFDGGDNGSEGARCATMCHSDEGAMYTTGGGHVDVWHWKAHRTNPIGLADDKWWDGTGRGSDEKTVSAYKDNETTSENFPLYAGPITDGHFIIIPSGGSTGDLEAFDSTDATLQSNTYPGYYLNANATNSGESRHDVRAAGKYVN